MVVWCPDWPVIAAGSAAGLGQDAPAAVVLANRVVACSSTARAEGVRGDMRRREAQSRCPELTVFDDDPARDARLFEPVAVAVEELAVGVEVVRPGVVAVPARGPVGYFGGEERTAELLVDQVATHAGVESQVGIADGLFAALLAAHRGLLVPPGNSAEFLAPLGVHELHQSLQRRDAGRAELVDLLRRLGLRTLGAFAEIPERDVASRFGADAVLAHRLARGLEERPLARRAPPKDLSVEESLDPPVDRVDAAAFVAKTLAERLYAGLVAHGLACARLGVHARTEHGEELSRVWRCAEPLVLSGIADRVRWQLDGWLRGPDRPTAGISVLRLDPEEVIDGAALQLELWRGQGHAEAEERAGRSLVRVQGLLGPDGVLVPVLGGGRGPAERVRLVPWGDERVPALAPDLPWPGRLPAPSPTVLPVRPTPVTVLDEKGTPVDVTGRYQVTAIPHRVAVAGGPAREVLGWAGPWPADERWWHPGEGRQRARMQAVLAAETDDTAETALLLSYEDGGWQVEGSYV